MLGLMSPYGSDGVDVTLIRWMLSLTPAERVEQLQAYVDSLYELLGEDAINRIYFDPASPR